MRIISKIGMCFAAATLALCLGGCKSGDLVRKSDKELASMQMASNNAAKAFRLGKYTDAERLFLQLSQEKTVNQPLYHCELAATYLALGNSDKAYQYLVKAQRSAEMFFDKRSEKKAASLWGSEVQKVYKGEAYERSTLYLLLGLMFLEMEKVDNALASFKSGLLCDADVEKSQYSSDYGLLHLMAARCCQLRDEPEMAKKYTEEAVKSFLHSRPDLIGVTQAILGVKALAPGESVAPILNRLTTIYGDEAKNLTTKKDILEFAKKKIRAGDNPDYYKPLTEEYNTLIVVWTGNAPYYVRYGRYGEMRHPQPGLQPLTEYSVIDKSGIESDALRGFSSLSYQATTRGGRTMDRVLEGHAKFKGFTEDTGDAMWQVARETDSPGVAVVFLVLGGISKGVSATAKAGADTRCWQTLPNEFQVIPMKLPAGEHKLFLCAYCRTMPLKASPVEFKVDKSKPINVIHVFPRNLGLAEMQEKLQIILQQKAWFCRAKTGCYKADTDRNGEISTVEMNEAMAWLLKTFDINQDGKIDPLEWRKVLSTTNSRFQKEMTR